MVSKVDTPTYRKIISNKDSFGYDCLPIVMPDKSSRIQSILNEFYLKDNSIDFSSIATLHLTSICTTNLALEDVMVQLDFYQEPLDVVKLHLANLILRAKYVKGSLLEALISTNELLSALEKDFGTEQVQSYKDDLFVAIQETKAYEIINPLTTLDLLESPRFSLITYTLVSLLGKYNTFPQSMVVDISELKGLMTGEKSMYFKYFIQSLTFIIQDSNVKHCYGSVDIVGDLLPFFNIKGVVTDSILRQRKMYPFTDLGAVLRKLSTFVPMLDNSDFEYGLNCALELSRLKDSEALTRYSIVMGELLRIVIQFREYKNEKIYESVLAELLKTL